ncbi:follistatin-related protein 5-like isoform X2 [Argiope bruennichi]|uniref:follistatin-related protein 5-like isoform X2 n=1 Tax=Argiope bruennichi TaxID=94029 RepID=UPI002494EE6F|nr:follistatin-related protein 5-like isoform X2 [Argiope bruennichi]
MILRSLKTPLLFIVLCFVFTTCKGHRVDDDSHFNDADEDHFLGIDSEDGHEDEEPLPPLALPLQNDVVGNKGCSRNTCGRWRECETNSLGDAICTCHKYCKKRKKPVCGTDGRYYANHCELHRQACLTDTTIAIDHKRLCLKKRILETTTTDVETSAEDVSTSNTPVTTLGTTDRRTDDPSSWTNIPQPEPRTVAPSVPLSTVLPLTTMMTQTSDVDSELPPQRECSQQDYDFMKENLLLFNSAKLTDSKKPGNEYLVSIMFSHYDQNNNGQLEAEELWQAAERDHLGQLSKSCILADMLLFDDTDRDGAMSINEFYLAFSKLNSVSVVSLDKALEVNHVTARVGDNVEIKCDVTGTPPPPIVWRRNDMDLASLNEDEIKVFVDGSLYLTNVQLIHGGNYTCHAQHNRDVVQTHILHVHTIPEVHVIPKLQSRAPGELAEMECHVIGVPTPAVSWLKNDEELKLMTDKYTIVGNGTALLVGKITYSDTGAYMCVASNPAGMTRDITSLIVQDQPTPTAPSEERRFFVFHDWGVSVFDPDNCRLYHQIQSTDVIPGTQEYVCGDRGINCSWGHAINVADRYVYVTQPTKDRVLIISRVQMVVVDVVVTDKVPVDIHYVPHLDQVWIVCWRGREDRGTKTIQIIRDASQKKKHHTVHPEPVDGHFDLVSGLFIPPTQDLGHGWKYGYVVHTNQRGMYKLDLQAMKYIKTVDLTPYNCAPKTADFSTLGGFAILECREPITDRPTGQVVLDYLTDTVLSHKTALFGQPHVSPDSRHVVTLERTNNSVIIVAQQITENGLRFLFDVKTTLQIGDITFFPSRTTHNYDLYASSSTKEDILFVNLADGKVEMITGIGRSMDPMVAEWGNTNRPISSAGVFGTYMVTTANEAIFVINGKTRTVNCEIGSTVHPRMVVWAKAP